MVGFLGGILVNIANSKNADAHSQKVATMFGEIVKRYDFLNHLLSGSLDRLWRRVLTQTVLFSNSKRLQKNSPFILDLAAGTLDVAIALHHRSSSVKVPAMDFCLPMLQYGQEKLRKKGADQSIWPVAADARSLPMPDACVDGITMAFGIRNILPRHEAFAEMLRVLVPGGRACILEFGSGKKRIWCGLYNLYLNHILPFIGKISSKTDAYRYLTETICAFPRAEELTEELHQAGFAKVYAMPLCSGIVWLHVAEKEDG